MHTALDELGGPAVVLIIAGKARGDERTLQRNNRRRAFGGIRYCGASNTSELPRRVGDVKPNDVIRRLIETVPEPKSEL